MREDDNTVVEFALSTEGGKTRRRVVESGFAALGTSDDLRDKAIRFNTSGWSQVFEAVEKRAEQTSA